ncbi:MAG: aminotransferase class V-fold PLP-dependent enzyme [Alphaproteobacteria bacterium]|nr:aminotransferase class V-fold PLP-dependent enzyme [Alphaproteobacteria bacterium]
MNKSLNTINDNMTPKIQHQYRDDFAVFSNKPDLVFLDSAASAQKPRIVMQAMLEMAENSYANVHRGQYGLSIDATNIYEQARQDMQGFINAKSKDEIIFTRNATESFNLLSHCLPHSLLKTGDEIAITRLEHHSNFVPWLRLKNAHPLHVIAPDANGNITEAQIEQLFAEHPIKLLSITHISNVCGTLLPIKRFAEIAHQHGAYILVDGAQAAPHVPLDMQDLDADFYILTGHKLYAPNAIAVLYGKYHLLETLPPFISGGGMVDRVTETEANFLPPPTRFEAGTPPIMEAAGLSAAIDYLNAIGMETIKNAEQKLTQILHDMLMQKPYIALVGNPEHRACVFGFNMQRKDGTLIAAHDVATLLDEQNIAVRAGHHCAQPLMNHFGINGCVRASLGIYNDENDIDRLSDGLDKIAKMLRAI